MKRKFVPMLALMAALMVGEGNMSFAANDPPHTAQMGEEQMQRKQFEKMAHKLKLTNDQKEQIKALFKEAAAQNKPIKDKLLAGRQKMRQLIEADTFDEAAVKALAAEQANLHADLSVARARLMHQVRDVLTPEQRELAKKLKFDRERRKRSRVTQPPKQQQQ